MALVESSSDELVALVGGLSSVQMDEYAVVGSYMRFGERVREQLKDACLRIAEACAQPAKRRDNHLLWAAPGSGKTYFVEQVAASLPAIDYVELNLAKLTEARFREGLAQAIAGGPTVCLIDEVDAKPEEPWPYEALMPFLDVNLERGGGIVFVLAGSSGSTIEGFKDRIRARPKGTDVLSRVPEANGWEIAPLDAGDRILVALSQMLNAASELDRSISGVEKLALHYLAAAPHLANARQLREFAVRAVERGSANSDRIRYDDLFETGDPENKTYWASVMPQAEALVSSFVRIRDVATSPPGSPSARLEKPLAHLPVPTTPFFGRESELEELLALLTREHVRLVTLTGPGGSGKTRLALQAAAALADGFADGVFFVGLAPLRDTSAVHATVAEAVGLEADTDLTGWLASRRALLVLDNLEHLRGVEAVVGELLVGETVVLATARGPLRLSAERELTVEPLAREAAVELFVSRAAATGRHIAADATVGEICRRLDDLPLALELAAARVRLLSPPALLQRLGESLALLTGGARDLPERQRTLRATIEWIHDLLTADEQAAFRRLSVFRGSFTLEAVEAIAGAELDQVATLVEQSLLKPLGDERYFLLETLREYARERLDVSGEADEYALRHARWYLERLEENHPEMGGPRRGKLVAWFVSEEDNLRAMLTVLAAASPSQAARAVRLLHPYWKSRGAYGEERQRLTELLELEDVPDRARAELFGWLSDIEFMVGDLDASEATARESLRLAEPGSGTRAYALLGWRWRRERAASPRRPSDSAASCFRTSKPSTISSGLGFVLTSAVSSGTRAWERKRGRRTCRPPTRGVGWATRSSSLKRTTIRAGSTFSSSDTKLPRQASARCLRSSGASATPLGTPTRSAASASHGSVSAGAPRHAPPSRRRSRTSPPTPPPGVELTATLQWLALAAEPGDVRSAARILGAVAAVRESARLTGWPGELELRRRFEPPLIDALGEDEWAREQAAGAMLTLEEAIELARTLAATQPEAATHSA
jgi:predicted ATPase